MPNEIKNNQEKEIKQDKDGFSLGCLTMLIYSVIAFIFLVLSRDELRYLPISERRDLDLFDIILGIAQALFLLAVIAIFSLVLWLPIRLIRGKEKSPDPRSLVLRVSIIIGAIVILLFLNSIFCG